MPEGINDWGLATDLGQCRLCGSTAGQRHYWPERYADSGQGLRRCGYCAGVYLAPGFTETGLISFYQGPYRRLFPAEVPWRDQARFFAWRGDRDSARQRLGLIAPALAPGARLVEMGSGFGAFLGQAAALRPDLTLAASEPDIAHRTALLEGAPVQFFDNLQHVAVGSADALVAFHVLEHLPDPLGFLEQAGQVLCEGGQLWVEVPDLMADWQTRLFVHPAHLSYFCADTLRRLAEAAGLQVIHCGAHPLDTMADTLWLQARRPHTPLPTPMAAAQDGQVAAIDAWVERVGWGRKDRFKQLGKRLALAAFGAGLVGELQRWRHHRSRARQERAR